MLITELDKRGAISKNDFAELLRASTISAREKAPPHLQERFRLDLFLAEKLADHLADPKPQEPWKPIVIEGGKDRPSAD